MWEHCSLIPPMQGCRSQGRLHVAALSELVGVWLLRNASGAHCFRSHQTIHCSHLPLLTSGLTLSSSSCLSTVQPCTPCI